MSEETKLPGFVTVHKWSATEAELRTEHGRTHVCGPANLAVAERMAQLWNDAHRAERAGA